MDTLIERPSQDGEATATQRVGDPSELKIGDRVECTLSGMQGEVRHTSKGVLILWSDGCLTVRNKLTLILIKELLW